MFEKGNRGGHHIALSATQRANLAKVQGIEKKGRRVLLVEIETDKGE